MYIIYKIINEITHYRCGHTWIKNRKKADLWDKNVAKTMAQLLDAQITKA